MEIISNSKISKTNDVMLGNDKLSCLGTSVLPARIRRIVQYFFWLCSLPGFTPTVIFSSIRSFLVLFGMSWKPIWKPHRRSNRGLWLSDFEFRAFRTKAVAFRNSQDGSRLLPPASTCSYYRPLKAFKGLERGQGAVIHSPWLNHNRRLDWSKASANATLLQCMNDVRCHWTDPKLLLVLLYCSAWKRRRRWISTGAL